MKQGYDRLQMNTGQIELHLMSALNALTPNVLDRIPLSPERDAEAENAAALEDSGAKLSYRKQL